MTEEPRQLGKYLLLDVIGEGSYARVYRAVQSGLLGFRKQVAVKQILPHVLEDKNAIRGIVNEARLGGYLHHRNLVEMYEFDQEGRTFFIAMEFVPGHSLKQVLAQTPTLGKLPPPIIAEITLQLCEGLAYAHAAHDDSGQPLNLIHRDLKPGNVMISPEGVVKLMDFGVAKSAANLFHTQVENITRGTPAYMSPDQVRGLILDRRSDLFSLGSVMAEMITGQKLFTNVNRHALLAMVEAAKVDDVLARVDRRMPQITPVLRKALQRERDQRYATASEMSGDLTQACADLLGRENLGAWLVSWMGAAEHPPETTEAGGTTQVEVPTGGIAEAGGETERSLTIELDLDEMQGDTPGTGEQPLPVARVSTTVRIPGEHENPGLLDMVMVRFEPGTFWMGSRQDDPDGSPDEFLHRVQLSRPFLLATTPVTQAQWTALMGENPAWNKGDELPVESISWHDAVAFCNRLSESLGFRPAYRHENESVTWARNTDGFRLPSEAEWEFAARSGEEHVFAASTDPAEVAWHWNNAEGVIKSVGGLKPTSSGLYDMSGNVAEWVWDRYGPYPAESMVVDPSGPARGEMRVCRGGSSFSIASDVRVAARYANAQQDECYFFLGFRLARTILGQSGVDDTQSLAVGKETPEPLVDNDDTSPTPIPVPLPKKAK